VNVEFLNYFCMKYICLINLLWFNSNKGKDAYSKQFAIIHVQVRIVVEGKEASTLLYLSVTAGKDINHAPVAIIHAPSYSCPLLRLFLTC